MNKICTIHYSDRRRLPGSLRKLILLISLMMPVALAASAQSVKVTGRVTDTQGEALVGVSVRVKDLAATSTDGNGRYSLNVPQAGATLVFTYIGFKSQERKVGSQPVMNVVLVEEANSLNEVVVVGYGTQRRSDLTGAVGSVNMKDFEKAPVSSFDQALAGRVAGVQVQSSDGQPGSTANIVIRGAGSITQDNSPLYVIDGFPSEDANANSISPADIESIDILKDASATAIYGARGANGVVLITTKKGKAGKPQISYNGYYGLQKTPQTMDLMSPYQFVTYVRELNSEYADSAYFKNGITPEDYLAVKGLDMQDYVFVTGNNQNHDIALRGGTEGTRYSISGNFNNVEGVIINSGFKRYQGRMALDQTVNKKLKAGVNVNYAYSAANGQPVSATNFYASSSVLYSVWGYRPTVSLANGSSSLDLLDVFYDPENEDNTSQDYRVNPYINLRNQVTKIMTNSLVANGYAEYAFSKKLNLRISGGVTRNTQERNIFNNSNTQSGSKWAASGPNGTVVFVPVTTWLNDNTLNYKTTINKDHRLNVLAGVSFQGNTSSFRSLYASQLTNESLGLDALDLALPANTVISSYSSRWKMASLLSRINYDYKSKYLLTATIRADGSSKFAKSERWGYFPSVSAAWRFQSEPFLKDISWLSDGKLRTGYGESGNNRVSDFAYLPQLSMTNVQYWYSAGNSDPELGAVISAAGNGDLKWETNRQTNIGLDLGFLKQRISLTADIYKRVTKDLLLNASLPYANGILNATGYKNIGSLENKGLELALNTVNIESKDFSWSSNFNISFNKNRILSLAEGQNSLLSGSGTFFNTTFSSLSPYISVKGRPVGEMYGLIFDGIYQYSDFDLMPNGAWLLKPEVTTNGSTRASIRPGDIKYRDLNGDNTITTADYTIIGRGLPIHTGGFTNNFRYKNFDLSVLMQWSYGNNIINANRYVFEGGIVTNLRLNQFASYEDRWRPDNPSNTMYRAGGMTNANYSSRVVEDGSYLRLKTVSLGYNVGQRVLSRIGFSSLRAYVSAQNLFTITNYSGMDPEVSARQGNLTPGFDYGAYPHSLSAVFGINASF